MSNSSVLPFKGIQEASNASLPYIRAVTPTLNRHEFLPGQYEQFCAASKNYRGATEWVVVDVSPEPSDFMESLKDSRVHYIHMSRRRQDLEGLFKKYPELRKCFAPNSDTAQAEFQDLVRMKQNEPSKYPPRVTPLADFSLISLGEQRSVSIALHTDSPKRADIIVQLDDDDFYGPDYFVWAEKQMRDSDLVRQGNLFQYISDSGIWALYEFDSPNPTMKIRTTGEIISTILPEEIEVLRSKGEMSREGFGFGLAFIYSGKMVDDIFKEGGKPFPVLSLYEDGFMAAQIEARGGRLKFPQGDNPLICRILHSRNAGHGQANISIDTRIHQILDPEELAFKYPDMVRGVEKMVECNSIPKSEQAPAPAPAPAQLNVLQVGNRYE